MQSWRHGTVAMVALFGGLRLGEALALHWNNVDLDRKIIKIREAWSIPGNSASASRRRKAKPVDVTSRSRTFWSRHCESIARLNLNSNGMRRWPAPR